MAKKNGKLTSSSVGSSQHDLFLIDDETLKNPVVRDRVFCPTLDGCVKGHGLVPRDYRIHPKEMFAPPGDMPLIDLSQYDGIIEAQERDQSSWEHLMDWEPLDQNGQGYCWAYSTTQAVMGLRAVMHQPYVRLSAHAIGCKVKAFRDEGGWCGLSAKFLREVGVPSVALWPEKSMSREHDRPEVWANAALHKVTEEWIDLTRDVWDQNLSDRQIDTCALTNIPMGLDFPWWGHSVFGARLVKVEAGSYGRRIRNQWGNWGENGWATLRGEKARPSGAVALRVTRASAA